VWDREWWCCEEVVDRSSSGTVEPPPCSLSSRSLLSSSSSLLLLSRLLSTTSWHSIPLLADSVSRVDNDGSAVTAAQNSANQFFANDVCDDCDKDADNGPAVDWEVSAMTCGAIDVQRPSSCSSVTSCKATRSARTADSERPVCSDNRCRQ
jgi:hypothetical protein